MKVLVDAKRPARIDRDQFIDAIAIQKTASSGEMPASARGRKRPFR
jgi:hypothetical protein